MPSLQDALSKIQILAPVPKIRPQKVRPHSVKPDQARTKQAKKPVQDRKLPRRVPIETFAVAKQIPVYGETDAHSESRPPKQYDDVFPERHFGGPLYSSTKPAVPFLITKMKIGATK